MSDIAFKFRDIKHGESCCYAIYFNCLLILWFNYYFKVQGYKLIQKRINFSFQCYKSFKYWCVSELNLNF